ncbi:MAG: hypothetical protein K5686_00545 [Lachnospiraceae bacterium]|nr:hypothetical protein [Lachnospiraceae bacterium]
MPRPWEDQNNKYYDNYWGPEKVPFAIPMAELRTLIRDNDLPAPERVEELDDEQFYDAMVPIIKEKGLEPPAKMPELTREAFYDKMRANGWTREGDDAIIAAMYWLGCHNQMVYNPDIDFFNRMMNSSAATEEERNRLLTDVSKLEYNQLKLSRDLREVLRYKIWNISDARHKSDFLIEFAENAYVKAEDERVLDVIYDCYEKQGDDTGVLRIKYNEKSDGTHSDFANFLGENIRKAEREGWFNNEDEKYKLDILKEEYEKQNQISREIKARQDREDYLRETAVIRKYMDYAIKHHLEDVINSPAQVDLEWGTANEEQLTRKRNMLNAQKNLLYPLLTVLQDPRNSQAVENVKNGADTADQKWVFERIANTGMLREISKHDEVQQEQNLNILTRVFSNSIEDTSEIFTDEELKDSFWTNFSRTLTTNEIKTMQDKFLALTDAGLDWEEFVDTAAYNKLMFTHGFKTSEYSTSPYNLAMRSLEGREGENYMKTHLSVSQYDQMMKALEVIDKEFKEKGQGLMDMDVQELSGWFNHSGYDMIQNTILMTNGFEEKIVDGKSVKYIDLSSDVDESKLDRDLLTEDSYKKLIENAKEAQKIYNDNKNVFREIFDTMQSLHGSNLGGEILGDMVKSASMNKKALGEMNRFRHLLFNMKVADADTCKLIDLKNNNKDVLVKPLDENTTFDKNMVDKEKSYIDTCIEMLKEPTNRVSRSSREYWNVLDSLADMKKSMDKTYENDEEAKRAYIKSVNKVLSDINKYREHKAKDGVKQDATRDKLIALERVDKLLRTRYRSMEQREYEDNIYGIAELFKVEVEEGKMGDEYLYDKAMAKINNMNKSMDDLRAEFKLIDEEEAGKIKRSNTIGTTSAAKETAADIIGKMESPKKAELKKNLEKLDNNTHLKTAESKEEAFRNKMDPKDDYGKEMLIRSAEKELYIASVKEQARQKTVIDGPEAGEKFMNSRMSEVEKGNNLRYRTFKFENLTDKDFNKEFQKRVLDGAEKGKTSSRDIMTFADEALTACYEKNRSRSADFDKLSATLGSQVNSKNLKNKVNINKLKNEEAAKEPKKEEAPIRRTRTFDGKAELKNENGPKKK